MRKMQITKVFILLISFAVFISLTSFITTDKKYCGQYIHVKNTSTTRSITKLTLTSASGFASVNVNIPPGGIWGPGLCCFSGTATLSVTLSSGTTAGTITLNQGDFDGIPIACSNFSGPIASVSWSVTGCVHYYATIIDNASYCH